MIAPLWAGITAGFVSPFAASGPGTTDPTTFIYQLGAFGVAVLVAWWLLGRSDRALTAERVENQREVDRVLTLLDQEQKAHQETRSRLYTALEGNKP